MIIRLAKIIPTLSTCEMSKEIYECNDRCYNCSLSINGKLVQMIRIQQKRGHP